MIDQAVVLAAGLGKRMLPLTKSCPKPLLKVAGEPIILHILLALQKSGIKYVVIHVSYLSDLIINYINNLNLNLDIKFAISEQLLESGGGLELSLPYLNNPNAPFISVNSDIYTDFNFKELINLDNANDILGCLVLVKNPAHNLDGDYNIVNIDTENNLGILSKTPVSDNYKFDYTYSGIAVYNPEIFKINQTGLNNNIDCYSVTKIINSNLSKFKASLYNGMWHDIGSVERYNILNQQYLGINS